MRAINEVVVDRAEFKRAVQWVSRGKAAESMPTFLCFEDDGFTVVTPLAVTKVKSSGRWETPVALPSGVLKRWVGALPATKECTLVFLDGWLAAGKRRISAKIVAADLLAQVFD